MKPQQRHNSSQARGSSRVSQATAQRKQNKHQKHAPPTQSSSKNTVTQHVPLEYQQSILNVFTLAFSVTSQPDAFAQILQEVKGHLYNREFSAAFEKPEYLDVYASRWSAARALVYADIFMSSGRHTWFQSLTKKPTLFHDDTLRPQPSLNEVANPLATSSHPGAAEGKTECIPSHIDDSVASPESASVETTASAASSSTLVKARHYSKVVCLGGGAGAEIVALAATWRYLNCKHDTEDAPTEYVRLPAPELDILAIDIADWSGPVNNLSSAITTPPPLSNHASRNSRDANRALVQPETDGIVNISFKQQDILDMNLTSLRSILTDVSFVTIMFTLNELFTSSLSKTTTLLLNLTESMKVGSYLVIVDSPGSYSEIKLGQPASKERHDNAAKAVKRYPMKWLLDHTLLEVAGKEDGARWVKTEDEDSKWFRIDERMGLKYGIELENCRYQIHVFEKVK